MQHCAAKWREGVVSARPSKHAQVATRNKKALARGEGAESCGLCGVVSSEPVGDKAGLAVGSLDVGLGDGQVAVDLVEGGVSQHAL